MAAVVTQDIYSSYTPNKRAELRYTIRGAADEEAAHEALDLVAPLVFEGIQRREVNLTTEHCNQGGVGSESVNIHRADVLYYVDPFESEVVKAFDTTGGEQHITQSYLQMAYPSNSPNMQNAINYESKGTGGAVNGVDIIIPSMTFTERHYKTYSQCNQAYRNTLALLTGTVNNAVFRGYAIGEVLFKGAVGQQVVVNGTSKWGIDYTFAVSPNRTNFNVGNITGVDKTGWQYLWVLYADAVSQNRLIKVPAHVYVETIYPSANFSGLNIS